MSSLNPIAKILVGGGVIMIITGLIVAVFSGPWGATFIRLGRLPGDIAIEKENFRFYFPLATSILLSVILSLTLYIIRYFSR